VDQAYNRPEDLCLAFGNSENIFYLAKEITDFDSARGKGNIVWDEYIRRRSFSCNQTFFPFEETESTHTNYHLPPQSLPFKVEFLTERALRLTFYASANGREEAIPNLMIPGELPKSPWSAAASEDGMIYQGDGASLEINYKPMKITLKDSEGKTLTRTFCVRDNKSILNSNPLPFSFVQKVGDTRRQIAATWALAPGERIYGCGESFTGLNKRGQKIDLWTEDAAGAQTDKMYKPIPFYMSSRGYGVFVHTASLLSFDFGRAYDGAQTICGGGEVLDMFFFIGSPKEILTEYTALTGRSTMPPLWSFGLWMSRITYFSEREVRETARKLRENRIPCDVIHIDTGWFEQNWMCDWKFAKDRFPDPKKMMDDLRADGFRVSLWQLPYIEPENILYGEVLEKGYFVKQPDGEPPSGRAVIDMSNPEAVLWYQKLLEGLFALGASAIKADFGEGAPLAGLYFSGKTGLAEHNLYPLRYNQAVSNITQKCMKGSGQGSEAVIWARSAWAGSQRYPVHWGGDAETTDSAMLATLRAGLSLGLCGFSFWSHDIGGFSHISPRELYGRWLPFGMLTSHSRCHGVPPTEPWEYDEAFVAEFRKAVEMKYVLMPYIVEQARMCSEKGHPLMRTLFFDFPEDETAWLVEDEYMFGEDILVAPLFEENARERDVYLPPGEYTDFQTGKEYSGRCWRRIRAGEIPIVILTRKNADIKTAPAAQHIVVSI